MQKKPFQPPKNTQNSGQINNNHAQGQQKISGLMTSKSVTAKKELNLTFSRLKAQMNQAKVKTNIFAAIMKNPGFDGSPEELASTPKKINTLLKDATDLVLKQIPFDKENPVIRAVLYEPISECIKICWHKTDDPDPQMISNMYLEMFNNPVIISEQVFKDIENNMLKEAKASSGAVMCMGPILDLQRMDPDKKGIAFLMLGKKMPFDKYLGTIKKMIAKRVEAQVTQICPEFITPEEKNIFTRSVFNQVSEIFSQVLKSEYKRLESEVRNLKNDTTGHKQKEFLKKVENSSAGVLLDNTKKMADKMIHALYTTNFTPAQEIFNEENPSGDLSLSA